MLSKLNKEMGNTGLINKSVIIIDIANVSISNCYGPIVNILNEISNISAEYYPGNTVEIYIINVYYLFKKTWDLLKYSFNPTMTKYITMLDSTYMETLNKIIDKDNLP